MIDFSCDCGVLCKNWALFLFQGVIWMSNVMAYQIQCVKPAHVIHLLMRKITWRSVEPAGSAPAVISHAFTLFFRTNNVTCFFQGVMFFCMCVTDSNLELVKECAADKNTECKCKPRYYCPHAVSDSHCDHCSPVSTCPPGKGVTHQCKYQPLLDARLFKNGTDLWIYQNK